MSYRKVVMIKHRWRPGICKIYRTFGSRPFTAREALDTLGIKRSGMFTYLHDTDVIRIENGNKRSHYHSYSDGPTKWIFSDWFIKYLEEKGLKDFED